MSNPLAPPGWYPSEGRQRWWDGTAWTEQAPPPTAPRSNNPFRRIGCFGWAIVAVVAVVIVFVLIAALSTSDPGSKYGAKSVCKQFVEDRLKSPASAEFSDAEAVGKSGSWTVYGVVDSQNGFGATVRNYYKCPVDWVKGDTWESRGRVLVGDAPYRP